MGYTHYWKRIAKNITPSDEKKYQHALNDIKKVLKLHSNILANNQGISDTKPHIVNGIAFNGIEEESHDTFSLPKTFIQMEEYCFCKTQRNPYDSVVVACLHILKHHLKNAFYWSSDGEDKDLVDGINIANKVISTKKKSTISLKDIVMKK